MPTYEFKSCNPTALGTLQDLNNRSCVVLTDGYEFVSVSCELLSGSFSSSKLTIQRGDSLIGPWFDFDTAVHLDSANQHTGMVAVSSRYIRISVGTAFSAGARVDVVVFVGSGNQTTLATT